MHGEIADRMLRDKTRLNSRGGSVEHPVRADGLAGFPDEALFSKSLGLANRFFLLGNNILENRRRSVKPTRHRSTFKRLELRLVFQLSVEEEVGEAEEKESGVGELLVIRGNVTRLDKSLNYRGPRKPMGRGERAT